MADVEENEIGFGPNVAVLDNVVQAEEDGRAQPAAPKARRPVAKKAAPEPEAKTESFLDRAKGLFGFGGKAPEATTATKPEPKSAIKIPMSAAVASNAILVSVSGHAAVKSAPVDISQVHTYGQEDIKNWEIAQQRENELDARQEMADARLDRAIGNFRGAKIAALNASIDGSYNRNAMNDAVDQVKDSVNEDEYLKAGGAQGASRHERLMQGFEKLSAARKEQMRLLGHLKGAGFEPLAKGDVIERTAGEKELDEKLEQELTNVSKKLMALDKALQPLTDEDKAAGKVPLTTEERTATEHLKTAVEEQRASIFALQKGQQEYRQERQAYQNASVERAQVDAAAMGISVDDDRAYQEVRAKAYSEYKDPNRVLNTDRQPNEWNPTLVAMDIEPAGRLLDAAAERHAGETTQIRAERKENDAFNKFMKAQYAKGEDKSKEIFANQEDGKFQGIDVPKNAHVEIREGKDGYNVRVRADNYLSDKSDFQTIELKGLSAEQLKGMAFNVSDVGKTKFNYINQDKKLDIALNIRGNNVGQHVRNIHMDLNLTDTNGTASVKREQASLVGAEISPAQDKAQKQAAATVKDLKTRQQVQHVQHERADRIIPNKRRTQQHGQSQA